MAIADLVIVGAGTAGCVLATRLSADPSRTVVLLEAGRDFSDRTSMPAALTTGNGEGFDWGLSALVTAGRPAPLPKGKVVGGSAQVNGKGAVRALPADYDAWATKALPHGRGTTSCPPTAVLRPTTTSPTAPTMAHTVRCRSCGPTGIG